MVSYFVVSYLYCSSTVVPFGTVGIDIDLYSSIKNSFYDEKIFYLDKKRIKRLEMNK